MAKKLRFPSLPASHPFNRHPPGRGGRRRRNPGRSAVHTAKFDRCVRSVKASGYAKSPYAVCTASLGERGAIKSAHRRRRNPRRSRAARRIDWVILAERAGHRPLVFTGDRFMAGGHFSAVKFSSRTAAVLWARHLESRFRQPLRGWLLRVSRV